MKRIHLIVSGRVQGVGFRYFTYEVARKFCITGWVKNLHNGDVEVEAQGEPEKLIAFIEMLKQGHDYAIVTNIKQSDMAVNDDDFKFEIRGSFY